MFTRTLVLSRIPRARIPSMVMTAGLAALLTITTGACGKDTDKEVLAAFQGGAIERGDFRFFFDLVRAGERPTGKHLHDSPPGGHEGTPNQERILGQYAQLRLAAREARRRGLDKKESFKNLRAGLEERAVVEAMVSYLDQEYQGDDRYYYIIDVQHLYVKADGAGHKKRMQEHLKALNQGELKDAEIEAYIRKHHGLKAYRASGGKQVPVCESCGFKLYSFMTNALEYEPLNRFVHVPDIAGGSWLIRKYGQRLVRGDDLKSFYGKHLEKQAEQARAFLKVSTDAETKARIRKVIPLEAKTIEKKADEMTKYIAAETQRKSGQNTFRAISLHLARSADFKLHPMGRLPRPDPKNPHSYFSKLKRPFKTDTPLFSIKGKDFTYGELNALAPSSAFTQRQQLEVLSLAYLHRLWKERSEYKSMRTSATYRRVKTHRTNEMLALQLYKDTLKGEHVDWAQVKRYYSGASKKGNSVHSHDGSLRNVYAKLDRLRTTLVQKYKLKIHRDRLRPNAI